MKKKLEIIKIKDKKSWVDSFYKNVEEITEKEDYVKKNYIFEKNSNKLKLEIMKGKYNPEKDSIIFILISCQYSYYNNVIIYEGKFEEKEDGIYLIGCCQEVYPDYLKELGEIKFGIIIMLQLGIIMGCFVDFKELFISIVSVFIFLFIMWLVTKKTSYISDRKKLLRFLKSLGTQ